MKSVRKRVAAALVMCALAACSSGSKTTASTASTASTTLPTLPPTTAPKPPTPAMIVDVKRFLASDGKPLIEFEHATASLAAGETPTQETCTRFFASVFPKIYSGPNALVQLGYTTPDPALQSYFQQDISHKNTYLLACRATKKPLPERVIKTVTPFAAKLKARLALFGISI